MVTKYGLSPIVDNEAINNSIIIRDLNPSTKYEFGIRRGFIIR